MFSVSTEWPSWPERLSGHHLFNHPTGERVYLCMYLSIHSLLHSLLPVYTGQVVCNTHKDGGRHFVSSHFWEHTGSRMWPQLCHPGRCRQTGASLPPGHWTLTGIQFSFRDRTSPRSPGQWSREEPQTYHVWAEALREGFFLLLGCSCPCLQGLPCPLGLKREDSSADRQCVCIWGSLFHSGCWLVRFICGSYQTQCIHTKQRTLRMWPHHTSGRLRWVFRATVQLQMPRPPQHGPFVPLQGSTRDEVPQAHTTPKVEACVPGSWTWVLIQDKSVVLGENIFLKKSHKSCVPLPKCTYYLTLICRHKRVTHMNLPCLLILEIPMHLAILQLLLTIMVQALNNERPKKPRN